MKLRLQLTNEEPPASDAWGFPATAWTNGDGIVWVRPPFHLKLFARRRVAHEVEHNLEPDFSENSDHHPAWHFCGRVAHALRLRDAHLSPRSLRLADELLRTGTADAEG